MDFFSFVGVCECTRIGTLSFHKDKKHKNERKNSVTKLKVKTVCRYSLWFASEYVVNVKRMRSEHINKFAWVKLQWMDFLVQNKNDAAQSN